MQPEDIEERNPVATRTAWVAIVKPPGGEASFVIAAAHRQAALENHPIVAEWRKQQGEHSWPEIHEVPLVD